MRLIIYRNSSEQAAHYQLVHYSLDINASFNTSATVAEVGTGTADEVGSHCQLAQA